MIPQNLETERAILGLLMTGHDPYEVIEKLTIMDFYPTSHQIIYNSMRDLFRKGVNIDIITLTDNLKTQNKLEAVGISYLTLLTSSVPVSYNMPDYINILKQTSYKRQVYLLTLKYKDGQIEFNELTEAILKLPQLIRENEEQSLRDLFSATLSQAMKGVPYKFKLPLLNRLIGGLDHSEIMVIGGKTSMGKSMFGLQLATDFAESDLNVLYCTSEMSPVESARRILSRYTSTNIADFRKGLISTSQHEKIKQASEVLGEAWNINIRYTIYTYEIRNYIRKIKPDIIFVDHLHNMSRKEQKLSDYQRVTYNMRDIQVMAIELEKQPFVVLSQLSRYDKGKEFREPELSDLRDSGAIEEKANIVLFLHWQAKAKGEVRPRMGGEPPETVKMILAKNRDGVLGKFDLAFYPEYCKYEEFENKELK
jgi:replicative DNA helicase